MKILMHQPGALPMDVPESIPNPAFPEHTPSPTPAPKEPVKVPEKEPANLAPRIFPGCFFIKNIPVAQSATGMEVFQYNKSPPSGDGNVVFPANAQSCAFDIICPFFVPAKL